MTCRPYLPYVLAGVALFLSLGLIIFAICMERHPAPSNQLRMEKVKDSDWDWDYAESNAVLPIDGGVTGSASGDLQDIFAKALFLVAKTTTTTTTTPTESASVSGSTAIPLEYSTNFPIEVCLHLNYIYATLCYCHCCGNFLPCMLQSHREKAI